MEEYIKQRGLGDIHQKVINEERLSLEDGRRLYECTDILALGALADIVRVRKNGDNAYFNYNQHINYSNICINLCKFCAFGCKKEAGIAWEMSVEDVKEKIREHLDEPITEVHIVGGCHPDLPLEYYLDMLRGIKEVRPEVHLIAFTCVEIANFAKVSGNSVKKTLELLIDAGLGSLPGGGAEVFSPRIRKILCERKLSGDGWIEVAKTAHRLGLKSNATMLYGHIETIDERLEHMDVLRRTQDETGGFMSFIPLAFHSKNTQMSEIAATTGVTDLKNIAVSRLFLDNFPHIKAYWVMLGPKVAQIALSFGADDMDGTVKEETITHMAGGETCQALGHKTLIRLIKEAGRIPVERDTLYNVLKTF
ncbi:MAG: aminofutalosine synthase MqnE [Desulforhopalus sp.]|nr:aminofutalosine synthase MqnE [Desulforhopalus sp.]